MPLSTKRLARWLRDHGHDRVTIKKRGVTLDADLLRRQLKMTGRGKGGSEATLVLTRVGGGQVALVVDAGLTAAVAHGDGARPAQPAWRHTARARRSTWRPSRARACRRRWASSERT